MTDGTSLRRTLADVKRVVRFLPRTRFGLDRILGRMTAASRPLPDFVMLGAQKAGTTALYSWLLQTPGMMAPGVNEIHYFDLHSGRTVDWYRSWFPRMTQGGRDAPGPRSFTGEKTPYYLFHPAVPARLSATLPEARLLVLLRDPVRRAYSHFQHSREQGFEQEEDFNRALDLEEGRLAGAGPRLMRPGGRHFSHQHHSYMARGRYAEQLERWFEHVSPDRVLVLQSEELFSDPAAAYTRTCRFLGVEPGNEVDLRPRNVGGYDPRMGSAADRLRGYFRAPNEKLFSLLGQRWDWTS